LKDAPVPIIAVCPYCQVGRVRAPERAVGATANCPKCYSSFTVVDSGETEEVARQRVSAAQSVPPPAEPPNQAQVATGPLETTAVITVPRPLPAPMPSPVSTDEDDDSEGTDPARVATVFAFLLAGAGLIAAQFPYGRFGTVGGCAIGALLAVAAMLSARRPLWPAVAAGLNGVVLVVALLLPGWLGLAPWRPTKADDTSKTVQVVSAEGLQKPQSDWVEIGQAWQFDDVRVVGKATLGPIEMIGPKGQPAWSRKNYIQLRVKVANVGVVREVPFAGWDPAAVKFTDAAGTTVPPAKFDGGWAVTETYKTAKLTPGKSADWLLLFEVPTNPTEYFRIELPGAPCGVPDSPVRFQIPARPLGYRPKPESKP
jgi:hypothetical protein